MKDNEKLKNYSSLKQTKETWKLNLIHDFSLDTWLKKIEMKETIDNIWV